MHSSVFNPELFLELAEKLIQDNKYDEKSRSRVVVGRAYYSAFLKAQKKLGEIGYSLNDPHRVHKQVIDALREKKPDLGDKFSSLFDKRVEADYHVTANIGKDTGNASIKTAHRIIRELAQLTK